MANFNSFNDALQFTIETEDQSSIPLFRESDNTVVITVNS